MASEFAKAATALRGKARFAKIDTKQFPAVSPTLQVRGIPLLVLYAKRSAISWREPRRRDRGVRSRALVSGGPPSSPRASGFFDKD